MPGAPAHRDRGKHRLAINLRDPATCGRSHAGATNGLAELPQSMLDRKSQF